MTPQDENFEKEFIASGTPMTVTAILIQITPGELPLIWVRDGCYHLQSASYCGCKDVKVLRNGKDVFSVCPAHRIQPLGKASRTRTNWKFKAVQA